MKPGDRIICIDSSKKKGLDYSMFTNWVSRDEKYTIRRIENDMGGGKRILLEEIKNPSTFFSSLGGNAEPGFASSRFANYEDFVLGNYESEEAELEKVIYY